MSVLKHLPWVAPAVAVAVVGSGLSDRIQEMLSTGGQDVAQVASEDVAPAPATNPAPAPLAAADPVPVVPTQPTTTASQLAALLDETEVVPDVDVTRQQGFSVETLSGVVEQATAETAQPVATTEQIGSDFFSEAQANIAQANSCVNDLRNLANQARVYFPSGALSGEANGIAQARLIGTIAARCPGVRIEVLGHSDPSGDPAVNLRLSQERAETVISRISAAGIDTTKFFAIGVGSAQPSNVTGPQPSAYYDRRVEFVVVDTEQGASLTAPALGTTGDYRLVACVQRLQEAVQATTIAYAPGSVTASSEDVNAALGLAQLAVDCPQARLRVVGHHGDEFGDIEDASTGRMRALALKTAIIGAGYESTQIIMASPSDSKPLEGLPNARVDFDLLLEEI